VRKPLGIVITPSEAQYEGVDVVLDNVVRTGATMVSTSLGVVQPVGPGEGVREPPIDVAGEVRILDRPLWGQQVTYLRTYLPYEPNGASWADVPYSRPRVAPPGPLRTDVPRKILEGARARRLACYMQISPYTVPGAPGGQSVESGERAESGDRPVPVGAKRARAVVAGHGCLNNPGVRALGRARTRDAVLHYPDIDGLFMDWAEYACYFFEDAFTCFCPHCRSQADDWGYDWDRIERDVRALWDSLSHAAPALKQTWADPLALPYAIGELLARRPGVAEWLAFKARTVVERYRELRAAMDSVGGQSIALCANGFAPPWSLITGMDYRGLTEICEVVRCKLFTFHWPMIARWYAESLGEATGAAAGSLLPAVLSLLDTPRPSGHPWTSIDQFGMPAPDDDHPITLDALQRKVAQAVALAGDGADRVSAYIHSYRSLGQFEAIARAARSGLAGSVWVQRYGYLSDAKLDALRRVWAE